MNALIALWQAIDGYKTYIIGAITIVFAVTGMALGKISVAEGSIMISTALSSMGIRNGIAKLGA